MLRTLALAIFSAAMLPLSISRAAESLHERIDQAVESGQVAPSAPLSGDAEFLRRLYLDLAGRIPSSAEARAFLDDPSSNKRAALVEQLVASDDFCRHMTDVLDVMIMERRADKNVPSAEWRKYLYDGLVANKPYDQLAREILSADGVDPKLRPAAKFYLDRDAEVNLLTRDVARVFFGRDVQCAQCHDHPNISDYHQSDYYGLFAFLSRSVLFTDKDKKVFLGEKAEGGVDFQSVFTKQKGQTGPRLPDGEVLTEPVFAPGDEYTVRPADNVRPVPKYSRRALLAAEATSGRSAAFNRTFANRMWSLLFGRGIVEPVDMDHSANPPTNSVVLDLLTHEVVTLKYDIRSVLRELVLTRAYQRALDVSADLVQQAAHAEVQLAQAQIEHERLKGLADQTKAAAQSAAAAWIAAQNTAQPAADSLSKARMAASAAAQANSAAAAALTAAQQGLASKQDVSKSLSEAATKALEAAGKLAGDAELKQAADKIKARSDAVTAEAAALAKSVADLSPKAEAAAKALADTQEPLKTAQSQWEPLERQIAVLDRERLAANAQMRRDQVAVRQSAAQVADYKALADYRQATTTGVDAASPATEELTKRGSRRFTVAALRPLSPEQMAASTMQATGVADQLRAAAEAEWNTKNASAGNDPSRLAAKPREVAELSYTKLAANNGPFISLFGASAGQPQQDFHATVDQALFFSNGGPITGWIAPGGGNLAERLLKLDDPQALAEELYLAVLTRRPAETEVSEVSQCLAGHAAEKAIAVQELVWGLLSSAEFRFNH